MKIKSVICTVLAIIILAATLIIPAGAELSAKSYILISDTKINIGDTVTISVNVVGQGANVGSVDGILTYHQDVVEFVSSENANGSDGTLRLSAYDATNTDNNMLIVMTFRAIGTGSTYFSFSPNEVTDTEENYMSCTESSDLLTVINEDLSDNANLHSISLSAGSLSPSFSANTSDYKVYVANSTDEVVVSAIAQDDDAKVEISGDDYLQVGENKRVITVTAANGDTTKEYSITVYREEEKSVSSEDTKSDTYSESESETPSNADEDLVVKIGSKSYTIVNDFDKELIPKGFSLTTQYYGNVECNAARNENTDLTLFYLQDDSGECAFYVYNDAAKEFYKYSVLSSAKLNLTVLDKPTEVAVPDGFTETVISINNESYKAWKSSDEQYKNYYLIYGIADEYSAGLYLYHSTENTLQRFLNIVETVEIHDNADESFSLYAIIAIVTLAVISLTLFIIIIVLCKKHRDYKF